MIKIKNKEEKTIRERNRKKNRKNTKKITIRLVRKDRRMKEKEINQHRKIIIRETIKVWKEELM